MDTLSDCPKSWKVACTPAWLLWNTGAGPGHQVKDVTHDLEAACFTFGKASCHPPLAHPSWSLIYGSAVISCLVSSLLLLSGNSPLPRGNTFDVSKTQAR